jgi:hypothetical protein
MVHSERHIIAIPDEYQSPTLDELTNINNSNSTTSHIAVYLIIFNKTSFIWLGDASLSNSNLPSLDSLVVSMYSSQFGVSTSRLIDTRISPYEEGSEAFAGRLAKKYNIQVYVSNQLPESCQQSPVCYFIEKQISDLLKTHFG